MRSSAVAVELVRLWSPDNLRRAAPGMALCAAIARHGLHRRQEDVLRFGADLDSAANPHLGHRHGAAAAVRRRHLLKPGLEFAGRTLLRVGVALLGRAADLRRQLIDGGALPVLVAPGGGELHHRVRRLGRPPVWPVRDFGLLTGCATGVCGAAAAMAASAVLPKHVNPTATLPSR